MIRAGSKDPAIDLDTKLFNLLDNIKNTRPLCCHNSTAYTIIKSSISPPNSRVRVFFGNDSGRHYSARIEYAMPTKIISHP